MELFLLSAIVHLWLKWYRSKNGYISLGNNGILSKNNIHNIPDAQNPNMNTEFYTQGTFVVIRCQIYD